MNIVPPNVALPFEVTFEPGLFVAMKVFKVIAGVPTLEDTIPMDDVIGGTYVGFYTLEEGESYLFHKAVYTDGTYTTLNTNFVAGSETITADSPLEATLTALDIELIADAVWNELLSGHTTSGSAGKALSDVQPSAIASAVWDKAKSAHNIAGTFGELLDQKVSSLEKESDAATRYSALHLIATTTDNQAIQIQAGVDELKERLSDARADALDYLDAPISSRESEAAAAARGVSNIEEHDFTQLRVAAAISAAETPDPNVLVIRGLLEHASIGLAALSTSIGTRASQVDITTSLTRLSDILSRLDSGTIGLGALKTLIDAIQSTLANGTYGLSALKTVIDTKSSQVSVSALPDAAAIATAVWNFLTAASVSAGSYGDKLKTNLDVIVSTRSTGTDLATVNVLITAVKALVEHGTYGLAALKGEIDANETKIDTANAAITNVDSDLAAARAAIEADIAAIVDGTPTILAVLDAIKGASFAAGDDLHSIKAAIGTGSATLAKQNDILGELASIKGAGWSNQTLALIKSTEDATQTQLAAARTAIETKVDTANTKIDAVDASILGVKNRLDDGNFGLSAAKTQRDAIISSQGSNQSAVMSGLSTISGQVANVDSDLAAALASILSAVGMITTSGIQSTVTLILSKLEDGTSGLIALKNALDSIATNANSNQSALVALGNAIRADIDGVEGDLAAIKGVGFGSGNTLKALADAIAAIASVQGDQPLKTETDAIILKLHTIADGNTGTFNEDTDTLRALGQRGTFLQGFEAGEAE